VRDVVERAAHGRDEGLDAVEERVDLRPQLVQGVGGVADGDAGAELPCLQDVADGAAQVAQGLERGAREDVSPARGDQADEDEGDEQGAPHAGQELGAGLGALAHLKQRAVWQSRRKHF
jgi:hypothetical protein